LWPVCQVSKNEEGIWNALRDKFFFLFRKNMDEERIRSHLLDTVGDDILFSSQHYFRS
jgi:hypothetical protein